VYTSNELASEVRYAEVFFVILTKTIFEDFVELRVFFSFYLLAIA